MTVPSRKNAENNLVYTTSLHANHRNYLDFLKQEFNRIYENPTQCDKTVEDFDKIKTLGLGAYGTVFLVRDKGTFTYYAMKAIEKAEIVKHNTVKQVYREKRILQCVKFTFLISLNFCSKDNVYVYLIMPYEAGGEMFTIIKKLGLLSEPLAQFYAAQIALALEYLHHCSVIHRDLKPENIFLSESGYIKLGDFGFCKLIKNRTWTLCGTPEYLAPEIILSKGYSFPVDWWSFGIFIYEMIAGHPPFYSSQTISLYEKILEARFKTPDCMTPNCKSLVKNLLVVDPMKRYGSLKAGVYDIKHHPWFSETDWNLILHQKMTPPYIPVCKGHGDSSTDFDNSSIKLKKAPVCLFEKEFEDF